MKNFLLMVLTAVVVAIATANITADYMIKTAEPDFIEHTIEWDGQIHNYE